jgi:hypothetical protein
MLHMLKERFCLVLKSSGLGILFLLVVVPGCWDDGPKVVPVSGKVLRDGKALTNVAVTFLPVGSGLSATGSADSSGTIKMMTNGRSGAMVGRYKIGITEPLRDMTPESLASGSPPPMSFDAKFGSPELSGLEFNVSDVGGIFEFTVTNKAK